MNALNQTNITQLNITGVPLYNKGLSDLCRMLKSNKKIIYLYLMHIRANAYSELGDALSENTTLKSIYIQMHGKREFNLGLEMIEQGLRRNSTLERFKVSTVDVRAFEAICSAFKSHPNIKELEFHRTHEPLSPECLVALRSLLETNKSIVKLSLDSCMINQDSCAAICEGFRRNSTITELLLDGNHLTDRACSVIAQLLRHNSSLKKLSLNRNQETALNGMVEICKSLLENNTLDRLDLRGNSFDVNFYLALGRMIAKNTTLSSLEMMDEYFTFGELAFVTAELKTNCTLRTLVFNGVNDERTCNIWSNILKTNEALINVGAYKRSVQKETRNQLEKYLERNKQRQNVGANNILIVLFNLARDPCALNMLPTEMWFLVCRFIKIPGVSIDWSKILKKILDKKEQLKVLPSVRV